MEAVSAISAQLILVDEQDRPVGTCEKMEAHQKGLLHRAFSIFIFNRQGQMLLQQRALGKYHSGGCWTNACCSHPFPTEENRQAALRRLQEEGTSASQCVRDARLERALNLLQTTRQPIGHIAEACGYLSHSRFSAAFEQQFGILPIKLRQQIQPTKTFPIKKNPIRSVIGV
jgi:isopentenyl-diphosphate delta-isomerase type 1